MAERLIVEHLDGETLVYDTESDEAHCLGPEAAAEFEAASDDVSRREVIRRLALLGAAAAGAGPLVKSIVAPSPAMAQSLGTACTGANNTQGTCNAGLTCCSGVCRQLGTNSDCAFCGNVCGGAQMCTFVQGGFPPFQCIAPSDRNLKHHLVPVEPQDVLAAVAS